MKDKTYAKWMNGNITNSFRTEFEKLAAFIKKDFKETMDMNVQVTLDERNGDIKLCIGYFHQRTEKFTPVSTFIMIYGRSDVRHCNCTFIKNVIAYNTILMLMDKHKYVKIDFSDLSDEVFGAAQTNLVALELI